ncbi:MAG TPA: methyltransferase domain-containing protein [bacterium]
MHEIVKEYTKTSIILKILALILLIYGVPSESYGAIAFAVGYLIASKNPWRYRIIINTALTFHLILFFRELYLCLSAEACLLNAELLFNPLAMVFLIIFYPSPYPMLMNVSAFFLSPAANVNWMEKHTAQIKRLTKNSIIGTVEGLYYSSDSFNIIQEEGFLGFSPAKDIIHAALKAGLGDGKSLLDIGSGLGGPSCALAGEFRIRVDGVDLLKRNVLRANSLAKSRNLGKRVAFQQGNAMALPFMGQSFDFVFGSDAWCHVPDRKKLLQESHRVLKDKGVIFFYDWLNMGGVSEGFRFIYSFPPLETLESYREKLSASGFETLYAEYNNETFKDNVLEVNASLKRNKQRLIESCGRELYDNWTIVIHYTLKMILEGKLGHALFIAKKP